MASNSGKRKDYFRPLMSKRPITKRPFSFDLPNDLTLGKRRKVEDEVSSRAALHQIQPNVDGKFDRSQHSMSNQGRKTNESIRSANSSAFPRSRTHDQVCSTISRTASTDDQSDRSFQHSKSVQRSKSGVSLRSANISALPQSRTYDQVVSTSSRTTSTDGQSDRSIQHSKSVQRSKSGVSLRSVNISALPGPKRPDRTKSVDARDYSLTDGGQYNKSGQHSKSFQGSKSLESIHNINKSDLQGSKHFNQTAPSETPHAIKKKPVKRKLLEEFPSSISASNVDGNRTKQRWSNPLMSPNLSRKSQRHSANEKGFSVVEMEVIQHSNILSEKEAFQIDSPAELSMCSSPDINVKPDLYVKPNVSVKSDLYVIPNVSVKSDLYVKPNVSVKPSMNINPPECEADIDDSSTSTIVGVVPSSSRTSPRVNVPLSNADQVCLISPWKKDISQSERKKVSEEVEARGEIADDASDSNNERDMRSEEGDASKIVKKATDASEQTGESENEVVSRSKKKVMKWLRSECVTAPSIETPSLHDDDDDDDDDDDNDDYEQLILQLRKTKNFRISEDSMKMLKGMTLPLLVFEVQSVNQPPKPFRMPVEKGKKKKKPDPEERVGNVLKEVLVYNEGVNKHTVTQICDLEVILSALIKKFKDMRRLYTDEKKLLVLKRYEKIVTTKLLKTISTFAHLQRKTNTIKQLHREIKKNSEELGIRTDRMLKENAE